MTKHPHPHLKPLYSKSFLQSTSTLLLIINPLHSRVAHRSFDCRLFTWQFSTLLAGSTQVSTRVTRQGGLTRLDYFFHVNAYRHLTTEGLPFAVIQPGSDANPGSRKEALSGNLENNLTCNMCCL